MRGWERKDITDILVKHHEELREASLGLANSGDPEGWRELDDDCIVIEDFLEEAFGMEWQGDHFLDSHKNLV